MQSNVIAWTEDKQNIDSKIFLVVEYLEGQDSRY